jgi:unsaturated rhamnogalacturonyl hydrolase
MVDTLADLPTRISGREALRANLLRMADCLRGLQAPNGHWHTVLNEPASCLENSIAVFAFVAFRKGLRLGLLDASFEDAARRSWSALIEAVRPDGTILVSEATAAGDQGYYNSLEAGVYPWGQGALLRALEEAWLGARTAPFALD